MSRLSQKHFYVIGPVLFLQHPQLRGAWIRTDRCVILVPCVRCGRALGDGPVVMLDVVGVAPPWAHGDCQAA